jgi:hypothetical protein
MIMEQANPLLETLAGLALGVGFLVLIIWVPARMLHRAGYSRWYALPILFTGYIGLIMFAVVEWPIQRELAWHRWKLGEPDDGGIARVEAYAIDLERRGEWKRAIEVYEELARRAPTVEGADYYRESSTRLRERMG